MEGGRGRRRGGGTVRYLLVLRIVVFMLLLSCDTSECECIFSLMNDLKTSERNSLGQENLRSLMLWHCEGKDLPCSKVPVLEILKEFRLLAGLRGRSGHRPMMPPTYNFTVKVEMDDAPTSEPAPAPPPAPALAPALVHAPTAT